jgi:uncharacterized protein (DUF433 family)
MQFPELERITLDPMIMEAKPCIRGMRITVGTIVGLVASGASFEEILQLYPYLQSEDIPTSSRLLHKWAEGLQAGYHSNPAICLASATQPLI